MSRLVRARAGFMFTSLWVPQGSDADTEPLREDTLRARVLGVRTGLRSGVEGALILSGESGSDEHPASMAGDLTYLAGGADRETAREGRDGGSGREMGDREKRWGCSGHGLSTLNAETVQIL